MIFTVNILKINILMVLCSANYWQILANVSIYDSYDCNPVYSLQVLQTQAGARVFSSNSPPKARPVLLFHILNIYCVAWPTSWYLRRSRFFFHLLLLSRPSRSNQPHRKFGKARAPMRSIRTIPSLVCPLSGVYFSRWKEGRTKLLRR